MGYRACKSLYVAPAPLSAGGASKMASKVRNRVRNVSYKKIKNLICGKLSGSEVNTPFQTVT